MRGALDVAHMQDHAGVLVSHSHHTEVAGMRGTERQPADVGVALQQHQRAPPLQEVKQVRGGRSA